MKIVVYFNLPPGGAKRVVYEQVKYLVKQNHHVDIYKYEQTDDSYLPISKIAKSVIDYDINFPFKEGYKNRIKKDYFVFLVLKEFARNIAKTIDNNNYDIVIVHPDIFTQSPYLLKYLKTPSIYFCEELLRNTYEALLDVDKGLPIPNYLYEKAVRYFRKRVDKKNVRAATQIMCASDYIKNKINKAYKKEAYVNQLGVDIKVFNNKNVDKENFLLFIGQKEVINGYDLAREIIKGLNGDFNLKVIDFKKDKPRLTDNELARIYSRSFLTLCLSHEEPFGLASIESMACGTPVLAVNEGGYKESVIDGKTGFLLERDPEAFMEKIKLLDKDYKLYNLMSKKCVEEVKNNWTWEKHGERLVGVVKELVRKNKYKYD